MNEEKPTKRWKVSLKASFHSLFSISHIVYTALFFIILMIITILILFPRVGIGNVVLYIIISFALSYTILMILGIFPQLDRHLFSKDKRSTIKKLIIVIIVFGLSSLLILQYFQFGSSSQLFIQFLGWDIILPYLCIIIYFGWNLVQIFFIRKIFDNIATKVNEKTMVDRTNSERNKITSYIFLGVGIFLPILLQLITYFGLINYFEPQSPWFNGWNICMYIIIAFTSYRLIFLFIKSIRNETPNAFSSVFYIFIWFYLWYRSFSFIWSFRSATTITVGLDIFRIITDIFLMILTAIMVLKGLGDKLAKFKIFNQNNLPFFLFAFTILYFEGQIIMIMGAGSIPYGTYTSQPQINLVNNFLIILITLIFYWWYSEFILERKNYIFKENFKQEEVISLMKDFKDYLESTGALEIGKINDFEFRDFLRKKKLREKEL
ncbi:MAG: hypothetical protein ACFFGP_08545 [Promethearchaeota archaeon]